MFTGSRGWIPPTSQTAYYIQRICMIENRQPNSRHAVGKVLVQFLHGWRLVVHRDAVTGIACDRLAPCVLRPAAQCIVELRYISRGAIVATDRPDRFKDDTAHRALRRELRQGKSVLLTFMSMTVDVDHAGNAGHSGRVNGSRLVAPTRRVRRYASFSGR